MGLTKTAITSFGLVVTLLVILAPPSQVGFRKTEAGFDCPDGVRRMLRCLQRSDGTPGPIGV